MAWAVKDSGTRKRPLSNRRLIVWRMLPPAASRATAPAPSELETAELPAETEVFSAFVSVVVDEVDDLDAAGVDGQGIDDGLGTVGHPDHPERSAARQNASCRRSAASRHPRLPGPTTHRAGPRQRRRRDSHHSITIRS